MAYDAATGTVVLFGGLAPPKVLSDTWTWNGTTWAKQAQATRPPPPVRRVDGLRCGHKHCGPVRRRGQRWWLARRHLGLGLSPVNQAVRSPMKHTDAEIEEVARRFEAFADELDPETAEAEDLADLRPDIR
jgi:hypothetical protein